MNNNKRLLSAISFVCAGLMLCQSATAADYYVNAARGSARGQGTKESPMRCIQKAIDKAVNGDVIHIAEGNYLGNLDRGWIDMKGKYVNLEGGWNDSFSERNPTKYVTRIQPRPEHRGTINGTAGLLHLEATDRSQSVTIDGIFFDQGLMLEYMPNDPKDSRNGCPEGFETGRVKPVGNPPNPSVRSIGGKLAGKLIIRNCMFLNSSFYGIILTNSGGEWEIYNNVFVGNIYASCEISGGLNQQTSAHQSKVDFHHNTVLFSWTRTKEYEDMGYGYRYRNGVDHNVHHNIFGCSSLGALDCGWSDNTLPADKRKICNATDNRFFMNRGDAIVPGGGKWIYVKAARFDEVEFLTEYERNSEIEASSTFKDAIDPLFVNAFATLKVVTSESYDPNSSANQIRSALGLNQTGTSTTRVSMYANRYNFDKAIKLFGAMNGYGAQNPK